MKRKIILSREAVLWEAGDAARTFAVLESGKLGIRTDQGLQGIVIPGMVLGETALLTLEGEPQKRAARVFAIEEGTTVTEYPALVAKQGFEDSSHAVAKALLATLLGQIARNCLILLTTNKHDAMFSIPFKMLMQGLAQTYKPRFALLNRWDEFMTTFRFLLETRDYTDEMRQRFTVGSADKDAIFKASQIANEYFKEKEDLSFLSGFFAAEAERRDWVERSRG